MVQSSSISITPATHAANHVIGGTDPLVTPILVDPHTATHKPGGSDPVEMDFARGITPTREVTEWDVGATDLPNIVDGDLSSVTGVFSTTNGAGSSEKEEYHIDLGGLKNVVTVLLNHRLIGNDQLRGYIDVSVDGVSWVQLDSSTVTGGNARFVEMGHPVEPIRYVRARYNADGTASLKQVQIYSIQALAV